MRDHLPWLGQGDIFERTPVVDVFLTDAGDVRATIIEGPAVLLTHDCDMDKPDRSGNPRVQRMQFARLRAVDALPDDRQRTLRTTQENLAPFEVLYLSNVARFGESFILFSDPYYVPSAYFQPAFREYADHMEAEGDARYITAQDHDSRIGRLDDAQLTLMRQKMSAFWSRVTEDRPTS